MIVKGRAARRALVAPHGAEREARGGGVKTGRDRVFSRAVSCISFLIVFKGPETRAGIGFAADHSDISAVYPDTFCGLSDIFAVLSTGTGGAGVDLSTSTHSDT
ncbi:TPA: hypothetical protein QDB44_005211 [Burkholderia vietnamiensis]|nr:hypothetical protein [Burkholderia vietnamiensis]